MNKVRRIAFYSGPNSGKTVIALDTTQKLKKLNISAEYISEVIKPSAYEKKEIDFWENYKIFSKQLNSEIKFLKTNIPLVVTDGPPLMCCAYLEKRNYTCFKDCENIAITFEEHYKTLNFFVKRKYAHNPEGRWETPEQSLDMDQKIADILDRNNIKYDIISSDDAEYVVQKVMNNLKGKL